MSGAAAAGAPTSSRGRICQDECCGPTYGLGIRHRGAAAESRHEERDECFT